MKKLIFTLLIVVFGIGCTIHKQHLNKSNFQASITGTYRFVKDSTPNPNINFFEEIQIRTDGSFTYKYSIGSFIKNEIDGTWKLNGSRLNLNSTFDFSDQVKPVPCQSHANSNMEKGYCFEVTNQKDQKINYILIFNGDDNIMLHEQFDKTCINNITEIEKIQIITTSDMYSKVLYLPISTDKIKCFHVKINDIRSFDNEEWEFIDLNKIRPNAFNKKPSNYFLYKID